MADVSRGRLFVNRREPPRHQGLPLVLPSLLATVLAVLSAPVATQCQSLPILRPGNVADTSHGTPKTLFADAQAPVGQAVYPTPDRVRPVTDTTLGTPKALTADAQAPVGARQVASAPHKYVWAPPDATHGVPKTLYDNSFPVGAAVYPTPDRIRPVTDTGHGSLKTLFADTQAPVGKVGYVQNPAPLRLHATGTYSTPTPIITIDPGRPVFVSTITTTQADRPRPVTDTTYRAYALYIDPPLIPVSTGLTQPPPDRLRPVHDLSCSTPKGLQFDLQFPVGYQQLTPPPDRRAVFPGASYATNPSLLIVVAPTSVWADLSATSESWAEQPADTSTWTDVDPATGTWTNQ